MIRLGIDIGSTTAKLVAIDESGKILFSAYRRHNAKVRETLAASLADLAAVCPHCELRTRITGSVGMGLSEQYGIGFVQEVVAAARAIHVSNPDVATMIDIGGEDAKVVFFNNGEPGDLRMNGNCAGGTGAFIDQMAVILGTDVDSLNDLAMRATQIYPIASRCGVFCKTDIQNLVAKNASREDIAASIFHAVAVQTVVTLAHGCDMTPPLLFCGGPLTFIPALRKAFTEYLGLHDEHIVMPEYGALLPALGSALSTDDSDVAYSIDALTAKLAGMGSGPVVMSNRLQAVFSDDADYAAWMQRMSANKIGRAEIEPGCHDVFLGIDSGSTTTKIVVTNERAEILYSYYAGNAGSPIETVEKGLRALKERCDSIGAQLNIRGCCSTGYGEDLIKAAFQLNHGIVETMAHYLAAARLRKDVSFILDIGGQDMKAIFVSSGVIDRIEINEACSSGCGSFIETFAKTLGYTAGEFSDAACKAQQPCDLGTRCTVFMNSKVKQVLREGATVEDIAAGLAYSVVKNCLYKVLKLQNLSVLGSAIVVQGGTMRNDAVVRALELLTGAEVTRCDIPELMGAYGCALYSMKDCNKRLPLDEVIAKAHYTSTTLHCTGCDNRCLVVRYLFDNGKSYFSGNRCEKIFTNGEKGRTKGENMYSEKNRLLFARHSLTDGRITIGIPRVLGMFEDYPFWHTLFTESGVNVRLSGLSRYASYECSARMVMSDNICFPAKLVHSHIQNLIDKHVDRIFLPFVVHERRGTETNSYNCPIVTGYSEVVRSVQSKGTPIDSPSISFKDKSLAMRQCKNYLATLGIAPKTSAKAFETAWAEQERYADALARKNEDALRRSRERGVLTVMLAGRPYHADALIQHKVSDMLADMGINVITDDIVRRKDVSTDDVHFLAQWSYPNRILKAAEWCGEQGDDVQFVQMTSFGCGPDAFLTDEVRDLLSRHGKVLTLLKLDDINNVGSMKLRIRSLVESLRFVDEGRKRELVEFKTVPIYDESFRQYKILIPYFTPFLSPLIPPIMRVAGYDVENLPMSDVRSCDCGLKYANNEVCYPATLIVGDIVKAFEDGRYDPEHTVVAMTQTGGQCRASNYVGLIKKALVNAGFGGVPVISLTFSSDIKNNQPAFRINWLKVLPVALYAIVYSDCIAKFYYASAVREKTKGAAEALKDKYLDEAKRRIEANRPKDLLPLLGEAADAFNDICEDRETHKVGIVGEIFLKFNPFAQKNVTDWFIEQGIEVMPPSMTYFFTQTFVNRKVNEATFLQKRSSKDVLVGLFYKETKKRIEKMGAIASRFRYFTPFDDIFEMAEEARKVVSLNAQFGEGWLLPAEIMTYAQQGVNNVVSLQPFGCIANHIIARGIEKNIKSHYPNINMLSLDFDSGVSDVNVTNRLLLFVNNIT